MTSVLSHLQRLNGSNFILPLSFLLILGLFSSCGGTQKVTTKTKKVRVTKAPNPNDSNTSPTVDTIVWSEEEDVLKPPFVNEENLGPQKIKEEVYDLAYLLPLDADSYTRGDSENLKFINYFAGMQLAKEILEREGVSLNITIVDSENEDIKSTLARTVDSHTDAIVGLYDKEELVEAAKFAKENRIPFISPWKASRTITSENPYYVQLRPNLDEYYKAIVKDVADNYTADQVFVLGRESKRDQRMVNYIQSLGRAYYRSLESSPFQEYIVDEDSLRLGELVFDSIFHHDQTNVVIIPNFSFSKDENFIYSTVRKLTVEKGIPKMVLYGMEILLDSDKITFDHYSALNMHIARTKFVDEMDGDVRRFKKKFFETYGSIPTPDAYEGYDNLMFIGRNIHEHGKNFQYFLEEDRGYYLQAAYDVQKTFPKGIEDDSFQDIDYFENKHVDIISFDGRQFHRKSEN